MAEVFAPSRNPSFDYEVELIFRTETTDMGKGYAETRPLGPRPLRRAKLNWKVLTKDERDYIESFFYKVQGATFTWTPLDSDFSPLSIAPTLSRVTDGSLASRTYYVAYSFYKDSSSAETKISPEASLTINANKVVKVELPVFSSSADRARIYASETSGSLTLQTTTTERTWTEPTSGLVAGASPPSSNNLKEPLFWKAVAAPKFDKFRSNRYRTSLQLIEQVIA